MSLTEGCVFLQQGAKITEEQALEIYRGENDVRWEQLANPE
jgi:hypothetical protein